jgi:hypothetical protein
VANEEPQQDRSVIERLAEHISARGGDYNLVSSWASGQGGSSSSEASERLKRWLMERLNVPATDFHEPPDKSALSMSASQRQVYDRTFEAFHGFVQELLSKLDFPGNDREARMLRVLRTETRSTAVPFATGESGVYKRGVNESGSLYTPFSSGAKTLTAVPHARITSIYFLERTPGSGNTFLYGDSENEVTYMGHRLTTKNVTGKKNESAPGTDSSKWKTP